jgi:diadenosine tetraphosphatase ApaH/serine/threonine PP2A family protein phosphatase
MRALISDIHGNLEALDAVIRDIESRHVDDILCLGDIVGYGAEPEACLDVVMARSRRALMGNHDYALLHGAEGFNPLAAEVIRLTRESMASRMAGEAGGETPPACPPAEAGGCLPCLAVRHAAKSRWTYVEKLALTHAEDGVLHVHGSPLDPIFEYVFPDFAGRAWNPARIGDLLQAVPWVAFCGHTHFPCAIDSGLQCHYPAECNYRLILDRQRKYIVNTGSVGQPRDGDPRASYVLFDEVAHAVEWRRLPYDIAAASRKIEAMCGPGNWCARRLWSGK